MHVSIIWPSVSKKVKPGKTEKSLGPYYQPYLNTWKHKALTVHSIMSTWLWTAHQLFNLSNEKIYIGLIITLNTDLTQTEAIYVIVSRVLNSGLMNTVLLENMHEDWSGVKFCWKGRWYPLWMNMLQHCRKYWLNQIKSKYKVFLMPKYSVMKTYVYEGRASHIQRHCQYKARHW
jgi:hypothetical protein